MIAGAARTLPHTLRSVSTSDEDAAALSMLTGFDPDLARQVNQSEGRIRNQWFTQTSPLSGGGPGGGGGAVVGRTTPHAPSGPMSSPESRPWHQAHPHVPGPDHPCSGSGPRPPPSLLAQTPGARPPPPAPSRPPASGLAPVTRRSGSSIRGKARLPRRQQAPQVRHARLRLAALRPRFPGLPPAQTRPRQNALGQVVPAPAHHRIPTPHVMTRNDTLHDPQPATKPPTAARHTTQGHPHHRARGVGSKRRRRARNDHVYFLVL